MDTAWAKYLLLARGMRGSVDSGRLPSLRARPPRRAKKITRPEAAIVRARPQAGSKGGLRVHLVSYAERDGPVGRADARAHARDVPRHGRAV